MANTNSKEIKNWKLRQIRKENKVTQEDLAEALNISRSSYQHLETKGILTDDVLVRLSRFFDLPMEAFVSKKECDVPHTLNAPKINKFSSTPLSEEEKKLLSSYDGLSPENKSRMLGYLEGLFEKQTKKPQD